MRVLQLAAVFLAIAAVSQGCSCVPSSFESQYAGNTDVFKGSVVKRLKYIGNPQFGTAQYLVEVRKIFKGCTKKGDYVIVQTAVQSATCGVTDIKKNQLRLLSAVREEQCCKDAFPVFSINLCNDNRAWDDVPKAQRQWFLSRDFCCPCDESCQAQCFYDGKTYSPGDSFPATDGCNKCFCGDNGLVGCTKIGCVDPPCGGREPIQDNAGNELFCGRGPGRTDCPTGSYCDVHPTDLYAVCCPEECPPNSSYNGCGSACPRTCETLFDLIACPAVCKPGCQCNFGYVLHNGKCVRTLDCPIFN